jgi:uncharacterized protein
VNRLHLEKSPYLLQHAANPVDWYPWGEEAFSAAKVKGRPIFLSVGYSTCHWCHVMEKECFEDEAVASLMNEAFVSIKVDREERPDVDEHFMRICQLLTGGGGWPLTIVMTPDGEPFFAATYVPRESLFGRKGMLDLVPEIKSIWTTRRGEVESSAKEIGRALAKTSGQEASGTGGEAGATLRAWQALSGMFDSANGGFGDAPKFPMPTLYLLLLRAARRGEPEALRMVESGLTAMRNGGVYDQVGFGFHRYSTDAQWRVPHFEKMLYDQALLLMAYTEAWQATGKDFFRSTAREIAAYVLRDMTSPEGAFFSAEDADSEGEEGKFYVWSAKEIRGVLSAEDAAAFEARYGPSDGREIILHRNRLDASPPGRIESALREARSARVRPFRDDKVLADWNGLTIAAFARAGGAFDDPDLVRAATRAADFILQRMLREGRLLHRYRDGEAAITGFADDYACLLWGLIELYEAGFEERFLQTAFSLADVLVAHHWDAAAGGFFRTADDAGELLEGLASRAKPLIDGVVPSANSVALLAFLKLARISGNPAWQDKSDAIQRLYPADPAEDAYRYSFFLSAQDFAAGPGFEIVIAGDPSSSDTMAMAAEVRRRFLPEKILLLRPAQKEPTSIAALAPFTRPLLALNGKATAYVCRSYACALPTNDVATMVALLGAR